MLPESNVLLYRRRDDVYHAPWTRTKACGHNSIGKKVLSKVLGNLCFFCIEDALGIEVEFLPCSNDGILFCCVSLLTVVVL